MPNRGCGAVEALPLISASLFGGLQSRLLPSLAWLWPAILADGGRRPSLYVYQTVPLPTPLRPGAAKRREPLPPPAVRKGDICFSDAFDARKGSNCSPFSFGSTPPSFFQFSDTLPRRWPDKMTAFFAGNSFFGQSGLATVPLPLGSRPPPFPASPAVTPKSGEIPLPRQGFMCRLPVPV